MANNTIILIILSYRKYYSLIVSQTINIDKREYHDTYQIKMIVSVTLDEMHRYVYRNFNEAQSFHFSPLLKLFLVLFLCR